MKGMERVYFRTAREKSAKTQLGAALRSLENTCQPPQPAPKTTDSLYCAMMSKTLWPSWEDLLDLESSVSSLALIDREKHPKPLWKAIKQVNQRWPGFHLVSRLDAFVARARARLSEASDSEGDSDLARLRIKAEGSGDRALDAKAFLADLQKIQVDPKAAAKIRWDRYEDLLFQLSGNKWVELASKLPGPPALRCYTRALEIIVEHELLENHWVGEPWPLLQWIICLGNPAYSDLIKLHYPAEIFAEFYARDSEEKKATRERIKARERQRRFRARRFLPEKRYTEP